VRSRIHICLVLTIAAPDHSLNMRANGSMSNRMLRCRLTEPTITANGPFSIVVMSLRITVAFVLKHANLLFERSYASRQTSGSHLLAAQPT
jgi:hypothetical protein